MVKSLYVWVFTHSWVVANSLARQECKETWSAKGMPVWGMALLKFERRMKVGLVGVHQNSLPGLVGDWNKQADMPRCTLDGAA